MKEIKGDLIELAMQGEFDVILHGCNCFHTMGGGIAAQIKKAFPEAYNADIKAGISGDRNKLGSYSCVNIERNFYDFYVVNCYTQYFFGTDKPHVDYSAIRMCMTRVKQAFPGKSIGYPMIGAGLAGGDWGIISNIIDECLEGMDHTLVVYNG